MFLIVCIDLTRCWRPLQQKLHYRTVFCCLRAFRRFILPTSELLFRIILSYSFFDIFIMNGFLSIISHVTLFFCANSQRNKVSFLGTNSTGPRNEKASVAPPPWIVTLWVAVVSVSGTTKKKSGHLQACSPASCRQQLVLRGQKRLRRC